MIEQLRIGAAVYGHEERRLGTLSRIVVAGATGDATGAPQVTGLVVEPHADLSELLTAGGLDTPRARVAPVALAHEVSEERVALDCDERAFAALPLFERHEYTDAPTEGTGSRFRLGDLVNYLASAFGLGAAPYTPESEEITFNEAPGSASLPQRAPVWRAAPHERIGEVERALVDAATQRVTGLVIRRDSIQDDLVVVPVGAITSVEDGVAHVALSDEELDHLAPYTPQDAE